MKTTPLLRNNWKDYLMISFGLLLLAFAYAAFIVPENIVTGGVMGISMLIYYGCGKAINIAIPNYALNILLLMIAYRAVGRQFVVKTVYGSTVFSIFLGIFSEFFKQPLVAQQPFMNIMIGAVLAGIGLGIVYSHGGSSGGTDVIAAIFNKHYTISFGRMMLYVDMCIISSSWFLYHKVDMVMYGYVFLVINSIVADMVINEHFQAVQFFIISEKWQEIADAINVDTHRGCTIYDGMGWYTKRDVKTIYVVCRKYESLGLQRVIKAIDPGAFISMSNTSSVFGQGFDKMKVKAKDPIKKMNEMSVEKDEK